MHEQDKPTDTGGAKEGQQPLPSVRGSGNVLGGYRAPGDEKHHEPSPSHGAEQQPEARVEKALDHDTGYDKWGGKDEKVAKGSTASAPSTTSKGKTSESSGSSKEDLSPPTGHYGDGEMGGQGGKEPRP